MDKTVSNLLLCIPDMHCCNEMLVYGREVLDAKYAHVQVTARLGHSCAASRILAHSTVPTTLWNTLQAQAIQVEGG